jgi:hypothetical protein
MKLLTATHQGQGDRPGDFCHATEGELVLVGLVCARDRADPDGGCGCGRAFSGLSSHRATTTALVREVPLSVDDVRLAVGGYFATGGMGRDVLGEDGFTDLVDGTVAEMVDDARLWPVGTVVGRRLDHLLQHS